MFKFYYRILIILLTISLCPFKLLAADNKTYSFTITGDKDMSSPSCADIALSTLEAYRVIDDQLFVNSDNSIVVVLGYVARFTMSSWIMVANHEIGGHGARGRESNFKVSGYDVYPFNGETRFKWNPNNMYFYAPNNWSKGMYYRHIHYENVINTGGVQASHLLAENIKARYLQNNTINSVYGIGYFHTQTDQFTYIISLKKEERKSSEDGNDMKNYRENINFLYNSPYHITNSKLKKYALLDLIDPFLYYSIYSFGINNNVDIQMIEFNNVRYLPATRLVLAPYGLEMSLLNHFVINDYYFQLNLTYGKKQGLQPTTSGISFKTGQLYNYSNLSFGLELSLWSQPKLLTNNPGQEKTTKGYLGIVNTELGISENVDIVLSTGYKSAGFYQGQPLNKSVLIRGGLRFNF